MAFDFKKEFKEFYLPKGKPEIVTVPRMNYIAMRGRGDPQPGGRGLSAGHGRAVRRGLRPENEL